MRISVPQASAEILGQHEQTLGIKLHPLARRLPPPTEEELLQLEVELKDDWVGLVAYAEFDGRPCLLTGLARLLAWSRLGRNRKKVPACGIRRLAGDDALRFLLQEAVGRQERWTESRRAVVASLYADEVRAALSALQSSLGLEKGRNGTTDMVLGRLSQTSGPLVTLARRTARVDNAAFSDIFQGRRRALPQFAARDGVSRPMSHSGRAPYPPLVRKRSHPKGGIPLSWDSLTPKDPKADLVIIDESVPSEALKSEHIHREAILAYICSVDTPGQPNFPRNKETLLLAKDANAGTRWHYQGGSLAVRRVVEAPESEVNAAFCLILWFSRYPKQAAPRFPLTQQALKIPSSQERDDFELYDTILRAGCAQGKSTVLVPYCPDTESQHDIYLKINMACDRWGCTLIVPGRSEDDVQFPTLLKKTRHRVKGASK